MRSGPRDILSDWNRPADSRGIRRISYPPQVVVEASQVSRQIDVGHDGLTVEGEEVVNRRVATEDLRKTWWSHSGVSTSAVVRERGRAGVGVGGRGVRRVELRRIRWRVPGGRFLIHHRAWNLDAEKAVKSLDVPEVIGRARWGGVDSAQS